MMYSTNCGTSWHVNLWGEHFPVIALLSHCLTDEQNISGLCCHVVQQRLLMSAWTAVMWLQWIRINVIKCWYWWRAHITGSCSSGGRPLIIGVASQSPLLLSTLLCPWAGRCSLNCSQWVSTVWHLGTGSCCCTHRKARTEKDICEDSSICSAGFAITFCAAICSDALSVSIDVSEPSGGVPSPRAHLPLLLQSAVPCGAPDVACRIIHTHALMKVSIWPHMHTLSPQNHTGMGTLESLCSPCCSM